MNHKGRIKKVREYLDDKNIPSLLVKDSANLFYLTGLLGTEGFLILNKEEITFFTPQMYYQESIDNKERYGGVTIQEYKQDNFRKFLKRNKKISFIETEFTCPSVFAFQKKYGLKVSPLPDFVKDLRMLKDEEEIKLIKKALSINRKVLKEIEKKLAPRRTETGIAGEIHYLIRKYGGRREAFEPIVASGVHSSYPHHKNSNTAIKAGEPLVIDAGVDFGGYKSDLTRTFFPGGKHNKKFKEIYRILKEVQTETKNFAKPGLTGKEVHNYALDIMKKYKVEKYFIHGLGHGVGIDIHEKPVLNPASKDIIQKGCVFTIEPGIYIPHLGGIRIEDMVILKV
jgi:Xaa-Pro aminopeptidase